ncbi:MAG TPA: SH3 domain-containing protein [Bacilli bacterium]|nr:SH3 domain-containing protein [Bacilli bacterium]
MKNWTKILTLIACLSLLFSLVAVAADDGRYVKVTAYEVNIRSGASTEDPVIGRADYGESYAVLSTKNGWYQVSLGRDQVGWIHSSLVNEGSRFQSSNPTIEVVEAKADPLNVRGGNSTSYDIITTIAPGTTYPLLQTSGDWVQIRLPDERTGWVAKWLVDVREAKQKDSAQAEQRKATVLADTLNVRADGSLEANVLGTLTQGEIVAVQAQDGDWTEIDFHGAKGFVASEFLRLPDQPAPQAKAESPSDAQVDAPTLTLQEPTNIRSGPGTNFALLRTGAKGTKFPITGQSGNWFEIALEGGKAAWVAGWLTKVNGSLDGVAVKSHSLDNELRGKTIVLDAGHGGFDVGAVGPVTGVFEKDITLSLTRILYNKLLATGANVVLTRPDDQFVSLRDRVVIAEQQQADVFVSLHYNTHPDPKVSGTMTFYYDEDGEDHELANIVQEELVKAVGLPDMGTRFGDYAVLRDNPQTAILIETAFLSNPQEEMLCKDSGTQEKAAEAVFQGLVRYFEQENKQDGNP